MNDDCGAPAFENIDDILAEKIIAHSVRNTGEMQAPPGGREQEAHDASASFFKTVCTVTAIVSAVVVAALLSTVVIRVVRPVPDR